MGNKNQVGSFAQNRFGTFRLTSANGVALGAVANAVSVMPILSGGMGGSGSYIVRRITVANPYNTAGGAVPNGATAVITIGFDNAGGNLVSNSVTLTNLTAAGTYVDLTQASGLVAATLSTAYSNSAMFINVTTNVANLACQVDVYGEVVMF